MILHNPTAQRILIGGASGLVGTALQSLLAEAGHSVSTLVRRSVRNAHEISWNPDAGEVNLQALEGFDVFMNLSGENIAGRRWTESYKERLFSSRINPTSLLARSIKALNRPPTTFISASAVGFYGNRGDELLTEESAPGQDFLSDLARRWEEEALTVASGVRVVVLRTGVVLSAQGGALKKMLLPFKLGLGGRIGPGTQWMSWIALEDTVAAISHLIATPSVNGAVNLVAPNPVTNREFVISLAATLHRPAVLPVPAAIVKLVFGQMGELLLLSSQRVSSLKLERSGYQFKSPTLTLALDEILENRKIVT